MRHPLASAALLALIAAAGTAHADVPPAPAPAPAPAPTPAPAPAPATEPGVYGFEAVPASVIPESFREQMGAPLGAKVILVRLVAGGAADVAGLKIGDAILKVNGQDLPSDQNVNPHDPDTIAAFSAAVLKLAGTPTVGSKVDVVVEREGQPKTFTLTAMAERGYLGFSPTPSPMLPNKTLERFKLKADAGVVVTRVTKGSPAATAGLKVGDVLLKLAGQTIPTLKEFDLADGPGAGGFSKAFGRIAAAMRPGKEVEIVVQRDGQPVTLKATAADYTAMSKISAAAQGADDDDGDDDDEGHEGPEKPEGPEKAPPTPPTPAPTK